MDGETLDTIIDGMVTNNLIDHSHLLTGYIGSESVLKSVVNVLSLLREKDPGTVYGTSIHQNKTNMCLFCFCVGANDLLLRVEASYTTEALAD